MRQSQMIQMHPSEMRQMRQMRRLGWLVLAMLASAVHAAAPEPKPEPEPDWALRINPGDTLIGLSQRLLRAPYGWQAVQQHNAVPNPRRLVPGSMLHIPLEWLRQDAMLASVVHVQGEVEVQRGAAGVPSVVRVGDTLGADARVRTGADSALALRLANGSQLLVTPGTELTIEQLVSYPRVGHTSVRLNLLRGAVESKVTPLAQPLPPGMQRFQIRTPVVTLGVRGTVFRAQADADDSRTEVLTGEVQATGSASDGASSPAAVPAGFGVRTSTEGRPGAAEALLPAPVMVGGPTRDAEGALLAQWQAVPGAVAYRARVFEAPAATEAPGGADRLVRSARWTGTNARWRTLPPGDYHLRVRAVAAGSGLEGFDSESSFKLAVFVPQPAPLPPPASGLPEPDQSLLGSGVSFTWYGAAPALHYRLQVARGADFAAPLHDVTSTAPATFNLVQSRVALPPGRYFWRVASVDAEGRAGPFGRIRRFDLQAP